MGLIGFMFSVLLPRLRLPTTNLKKIAREMGNLSRDVRNSARMRNSTYRIVIPLGPAERSYWLEIAAGNPTIARKTSQTFRTDEAPKAALFSQTDRPLKGKKSLPGFLHFRQIETESQGIVQGGDAFIHYSPEGLVEKSALQIGDEKGNVWTLFFHPLTGHVDLADKAMGLKDLEAK